VFPDIYLDLFHFHTSARDVPYKPKFANLSIDAPRLLPILRNETHSSLYSTNVLIQYQSPQFPYHVPPWVQHITPSSTPSSSTT
jgi:hypothetical protein